LAGDDRSSGCLAAAFSESRAWCVLTLKPGTEPVRASVERFIRIWQFDPTDPRREKRLSEWIDNLIQGQGTLRGLLDATEERLQEQGRSRSPASSILFATVMLSTHSWLGAVEKSFG
jgi:hypothetical protein